MDHVEIKDGAKLENTILSRNTVIGERAQLKDCEIAPGATVQNDGNVTTSFWIIYHLLLAALLVLGSLITSNIVNPDSVAQGRTT